MKIETKHNISDKVFFIFENKVQFAFIKSICYNIWVNHDSSKNYKTTYKLWIQQEEIEKTFLESELFKTKEELINSLW